MLSRLVFSASGTLETRALFRMTKITFGNPNLMKMSSVESEGYARSSGPVGFRGRLGHLHEQSRSTLSEP